MELPDSKLKLTSSPSKHIGQSPFQVRFSHLPSFFEKPQILPLPYLLTDLRQIQNGIIGNLYNRLGSFGISVSLSLYIYIICVYLSLYIYIYCVFEKKIVWGCCSKFSFSVYLIFFRGKLSHSIRPLSFSFSFSLISLLKSFMLPLISLPFSLIFRPFPLIMPFRFF